MVQFVVIKTLSVEKMLREVLRVNIHKPWAAEFPLVAAVVTATTGLIRLQQNKCFSYHYITIDVRLLEQSCLADVACQPHTSPTSTSAHCVPQLRYKVSQPKGSILVTTADSELTNTRHTHHLWIQRRRSIVRKSYRRVKDKNIVCIEKIRQDST